MVFEQRPTSGSTARRSASKLRAQGAETEDRRAQTVFTAVEISLVQSRIGRSVGGAGWAALGVSGRGNCLRGGALELSCLLGPLVVVTDGGHVGASVVWERASTVNVRRLAPILEA